MVKRLKLSYEQTKIIFSNNRINLALAVPGSGKTTVLVERAQRLEKEGKVLVLTFSKRATEDITKRLVFTEKDCRIQTIHSWCLDVLTSAWDDLGRFFGSTEWPDAPIVLDEEEEYKFLEKHFPDEKNQKIFESIKKFRMFGIPPEQAYNLSNQGVSLGKTETKDLQFWKEYESFRQLKGLVTFDDMPHYAKQAFLVSAAARKHLDWDHFLLDEAQDTSVSQWDAISSLTMNVKTALFVGDANQRIYGWRGADGSIMTKVERMKESTIYTLSQSFRSSQEVANLANNLVGDKKTKIYTEKVGGSISTNGFETIEDEVAHVINNLQPDSVILARTNSYLEPFERELIRRNIPYSGAGFYKSDHIKGLVSLLEKDPTVLIAKTLFLDNERFSKIHRQDFELAFELIDSVGVEEFLKRARPQSTTTSTVTLLTGHGAKGLEWNNVFVVGVSAGVIPHRLSSDQLEERNILYVMVSRARDNTHITFTKQPSSFLIEANLLNGKYE